MLLSDMEEVKSGVINVIDIAADTMKVILRYMYTGQVDTELDSDSLLQILYGAEKYELKDLKLYCFSKLVTNINCRENVKITLRNFIEP